MNSFSCRNTIPTSSMQACQTTNANDLLSPLRTITDDLKDLFDLDHHWSGVGDFDNEVSPDLQAVKGNGKWNSPGTIGT